VEVRQFCATSDELSGWSKIGSLFLREVFTDFNLQRHDSFVVCKLEERLARKAAFVLQRPQAGTAKLDSPGMVAADHGKTPQVGAGHRDFPETRALLQRQVSKAWAV
jgi:hypothetical protein